MQLMFLWLCVSKYKARKKTFSKLKAVFFSLFGLNKLKMKVLHEIISFHHLWVEKCLCVQVCLMHVCVSSSG